MAELTPEDAKLVEQVHAALDEHDPVPASIIDAARSSFTWLTIDAELAALSEDSALATSGVRAETDARVLTFECSSGIVVLEVTRSGDTRRLVGQTDRPAHREVRHNGGLTEVDTDGHGRFRADGVVAGPVSVRCSFDNDAAPIVTSWVVV
jgi:hypothetical protein